jgi:hypothetical protein
MVKRLTIILLLAFPIFLHAQVINHINKVETLKIYGNGKTIIGQLNIQSARTLIFYRGSKQTVDTAGIYTTEYFFSPAERLLSFSLEIGIKFDKPIERSGIDGFNAGPAGSGTASVVSNMSDDLKEIAFAGTINCQCGLAEVKVKSKTPLFATITGVDGELK